MMINAKGPKIFWDRMAFSCLIANYSVAGANVIKQI